MNVRLTVVILTKNESIHIQRAINNVLGFADHILVLDSYSDDDTVSLAQALGAEVIFRPFDHYGAQRNHAIEYCKGRTEWMLFLDADEYLVDELKHEIKTAIQTSQVDGYVMPRRMMFMGQWIKHGGYYPTFLLRLFRPELARVDREVNEHITVHGVVKTLTHDIVDHNLKGVHGWLDKHNRYATYEAQCLFLAKTQDNQPVDFKALIHSTQAERKQWVRDKIWNHLPLLMRPFLYFMYRYFFRLGCLDGRVGFGFHFLQGCCYWVLIDMKCLETIKENSILDESSKTVSGT